MSSYLCQFEAIPFEPVTVEMAISYGTVDMERVHNMFARNPTRIDWVFPIHEIQMVVKFESSDTPRRVSMTIYKCSSNVKLEQIQFPKSDQRSFTPIIEEAVGQDEERHHIHVALPNPGPDGRVNLLFKFTKVEAVRVTTTPINN